MPESSELRVDRVGAAVAFGAGPILTVSVFVLISIFTVLIGLSLGSFLNVCISRLPRHESVVAPRSRCPECSAPIRGADNIPLLSWLLLRGRCRACGSSIAWRYPLVEAATAALFLLCFLEFDLTVTGGSEAVLCWLLLGLAATDAETLLLPDAMTLPGIALGILASGLPTGSGETPGFHWIPAGESLLGAACAAGVIVLIRGVYWLLRGSEGMGLGDAKLLALIAAWLGIWQTLLVLFLGVVAATMYGLALIASSALRARLGRSGHRITGKARLPLGAFLSAAGIFAIFQGKSLLDWYLRFFR